jgi:hypothetical protein
LVYYTRRDSMDLKTLLDLIANQGFPIALSILLIFRIDRFMQEIVVAQKEGYRTEGTLRNEGRVGEN